MDETSIPQDPQPDAISPTSEAPPPVEPLSFTDKFIGVLTEPAPTYENVRAAGARTSDWLIPVLILMIILAGGTLARFANPDFSSQIMEMQTKGIQERVDSGSMTQEQADQAVSQMESMSGFFGIFGAISAAIGYFIFFFIIALFYWLFTKFIMKGDATYGLVLSALGLSTFISSIDQLVSLLLTFVTGKPFANLSPVLFMDANVMTMGMGTKMLMMLNPIAIWAAWVLGIGLEKTANISRTKGMIAAFSIWIIFTLGTLAMGMGGMG